MGAREDGPQPDGGAGLALGVELAEGEEFWEVGPEEREGGFPDALLIGPEDAGGRGDGVGVVGGGGAEVGEEGVEGVGLLWNGSLTTCD